MHPRRIILIEWVEKFPKLKKSCGFLLMPVLAEGRTLSFEDQTWEIDSEAASYAPQVSVRNDFDLYQVAKAQVFNSKTTDTVPLFSRDAVATISAIALEV